MKHMLYLVLLFKAITCPAQTEEDCFMITNLISAKSFPSYFTSGVYNHPKFVYFKLKEKNTFARSFKTKLYLSDTFELDRFLKGISNKVLKRTYPDSVKHPISFNRLLELRDSLFRGKTRQLESNELEFELYNFSHANGFVFLNYGFYVPWVHADGTFQTRRVIVILKCNDNLEPLDWYCKGFLNDYMPGSIGYDNETGSYFTRTVSDQKGQDGNILFYTKILLKNGMWKYEGHFPLKVSESEKETLHIKSNYNGEIIPFNHKGEQYFWSAPSPVFTTTSKVNRAFDSSSNIETIKYRQILGVDHIPDGRILKAFSYQYYGKLKIGFTLMDSNLGVLKEMVIKEDFGEKQAHFCFGSDEDFVYSILSTEGEEVMVTQFLLEDLLIK